MKKIYTIRNLSQQQEHMWSASRVEEEVSACGLRHIKELFLQHLSKGEKILEAGCGLGAWVVYLGERGYDIVGIDHDIMVIDRLKDWKPELPVFQGDICHLPYADGSIGAYISLGVMEHFEEGCDEAMAEARRVLKPDGLVFFTVPMENIFRKIVAHPLRHLYLWWRRYKGDSIYFAEYRFTLREVENLLRDRAGSAYEGALVDGLLTAKDDGTTMRIVRLMCRRLALDLGYDPGGGEDERERVAALFVSLIETTPPDR